MNEVVVESANQQNSSDDAVMQPSSGQLLRQAREQQQMTVQTLAAMLKVPVHKLQALEEDRWDALTDSVFTRSLALSVCRILNIPSEPVLAGLPKLEGSKLSANPEGINAPFKDKTLRSLMSPSHDSSSGNAFKIVAALLIAVAGSAGLYFLPQWQSEEQETVEAAPASVEPELMFAPQAPGVVVSVQETTVAEQPAAAAAAQEPAPAPAETEAAAASAVQPAPEAAAAVPSADAAQPAQQNCTVVRRRFSNFFLYQFGEGFLVLPGRTEVRFSFAGCKAAKLLLRIQIQTQSVPIGAGLRADQVVLHPI